MNAEYPLMFNEADNRRSMESVTCEEVRGILSSFSVDKSPGPDGWTPEFFIHFIDDFIQDLTEMVEDVRVSGQIQGSINSTFIVLIPKRSGKLSFDDYRPISLCNTLYKIISKVIA